MPEVIEQIVPLFFRPDIEPDDPLCSGLRQRLARWDSGALRRAVVPLGRLIFARPERLAALRALDPRRTLVAVGAQDIPRPPREAIAMANEIGCRVELIAAAGHIAPLESPFAVTTLLDHWLQRTVEQE